MTTMIRRPSPRGTRIDKARQDRLREEFTALLEETLIEVQSVIGDEFKRFKRYVRKPDEKGPLRPRAGQTHRSRRSGWHVFRQRVGHLGVSGRARAGRACRRRARMRVPNRKPDPWPFQ